MKKYLFEVFDYAEKLRIRSLSFLIENDAQDYLDVLEQYFEIHDTKINRIDFLVTENVQATVDFFIAEIQRRRGIFFIFG